MLASYVWLSTCKISSVQTTSLLLAPSSSTSTLNLGARGAKRTGQTFRSKYYLQNFFRQQPGYLSQSLHVTVLSIKDMSSPRPFNRAVHTRMRYALRRTYKHKGRVRAETKTKDMLSQTPVNKAHPNQMKRIFSTPALLSKLGTRCCFPRLYNKSNHWV